MKFSTCTTFLYTDKYNPVSELLEFSLLLYMYIPVVYDSMY